MNRLRQPGDSEYDVLGLSPGATDEEIDSAFRRLIDGQGYKEGIPLNRQWLRARQIKDAHATLADPEKRRAYDESLGRAPEQAPWAMTAKDPATDDLIVPEKEPEALEPVENNSLPEAVVPNHDAPTGSEPERAPDTAPAPDADEVVGSVDEGPPPPDLSSAFNDNEEASASAFNDNKRVSVKNWGVAAAVAAGLGLVLVSSWPEWNSQPSMSEGTPGVAADRWQASGAGQGSVQTSAQTSGNLSGAAATGYDGQGAPSSDSPAASDAIGASDQRTTQDAGELVPGGVADAQSPAATKLGTAPAAAAGSTEAAEARAISPSPAPPSAPAPAVKTAVEAESSGSQVRSPAQWIGGGPTDADNRRGRYQGSVAVQVTVEPDGRVSNCAPVRGSGNAGLDAMTCRLVRERARFNPALDAQGRPVTSEAYTTFVWGRKPRN